MRHVTGIKTAIAVAAGVFFIANLTLAQGVPSTAEMVEQLKVQPAQPLTAPGGLTRSLRNLTIESVAPAVDSAPPPSLSLQIFFELDSANVRADSQQPLARLS